jgi:hypothetical protein
VKRYLQEKPQLPVSSTAASCRKTIRYPTTEGRNNRRLRTGRRRRQSRTFETTWTRGRDFHDPDNAREAVEYNVQAGTKARGKRGVCYITRSERRRTRCSSSKNTFTHKQRWQRRNQPYQTDHRKAWSYYLGGMIMRSCRPPIFIVPINIRSKTQDTHFCYNTMRFSY